MFCKNCGSQIPDSASFCNICGTAVEYEDSQMGTSTVSLNSKLKISKHKLIGIIALVAIVIVAATIVGIVVSSAMNSPEKSVENYLEAMLVEYDPIQASEYELVSGEQLLHGVVAASGADEDTAFSMISNRIGATVTDYDELLKWMSIELKTELMDEIKFDSSAVSFQVVGTQEMGADEFGEILSDLSDTLYSGDINLTDEIELKKIKEGKIVHIQLTANSLEDSKSDIVKIPVVKYGSDWKVCDDSGIFPNVMSDIL